MMAETPNNLVRIMLPSQAANQMAHASALCAFAA